MSLKVVKGASETSLDMIATAPRHDLPIGLVEWILDGKLLRPERVAAARRWLARGEHPDPRDVADAVVREALTHTS